MDLKEKLKNIGKNGELQRERKLDLLLDQLGLQKKRQPVDVILPALGIFGAGLAVGATLGLMFAPKRGDELRGELKERLDDLRERSAEQYRELKHKSEKAIEQARARMEDEDEQLEQPEAAS